MWSHISCKLFDYISASSLAWIKTEGQLQLGVNQLFKRYYYLSIFYILLSLKYINIFNLKPDVLALDVSPSYLLVSLHNRNNRMHLVSVPLAAGGWQSGVAASSAHCMQQLR